RGQGLGVRPRADRGRWRVRDDQGHRWPALRAATAHRAVAPVGPRARAGRPGQRRPAAGCDRRAPDLGAWRGRSWAPPGHGDGRPEGAPASAPGGSDLGRLRITVTGGVAPPGSGRGTAGPTLIIAVAPLEPWEADTVAITVPWPRNERSAVTGLKTTSYAENVVALAEARKVGATEAILPNLAGNLCEGTGTNVFVVRDGALSTPPLLAGCLAGVTRALLLEELPEADEDNVPMAALPRADEVLLPSSTRDVQPLRMLDGRELPGIEGPVAKRAIDAVAELQARDLDP